MKERRGVEGGREGRDWVGVRFGGKRHAKNLEMSIEWREMGIGMCKRGFFVFEGLVISSMVRLKCRDNNAPIFRTWMDDGRSWVYVLRWC
jgi:hypothetical protein